MNDTKVSKEIQTFPVEMVLELPEEIFLSICNIITKNDGSVLCSMRLNSDIFNASNENFKNEAIEKATAIMRRYGIDFEDALKRENCETIVVEARAIQVVIFELKNVTKEDILNLKSRGKLFDALVFDSWKAFADYHIGSILMAKPKTKTMPHFDNQEVTVVDLRFNEYMRILMHGHVFVLDKPLEHKEYIDLHSEAKWQVSDFANIFFNDKLIKSYFERLRGDFDFVLREQELGPCRLIYKQDGVRHELMYQVWHPLMLEVLRLTKPYKR